MGNWEKLPGLGTLWLLGDGTESTRALDKSAQLLKRKTFGGSLWDSHWLVNVFLAYQFLCHGI